MQQIVDYVLQHLVHYQKEQPSSCIRACLQNALFIQRYVTYKQVLLWITTLKSKFKLFKLIDSEEIDFSQDLFISDLIIKANSVTFNYNIDNFDTKFSYRIEYQDSNSTMWKIRINDEPRSYLVDYGFKSFSPNDKSGFVEMNINLFYLFVYTIGNLNFIVFYALIIFSAIYLPRYSDLQNSLKSNSNNN